jgi:O-antigen/teichoic acid export membrane protein
MDLNANGGGPRLRPLIVSGLAWKGISQVSTQVMRLLVAVTLARILAPHDYGLAGMVLVFTSFVLVVSDLALGSRLVQRQGLTDVDCSTAFWTSAGSGLFFTLLGVGLSGPISRFFGYEELGPMIAVLSLSFFFSGISLTQSALLVKSMSFRALELREMLAAFLGGGIGISVALFGFGAWAIIAQQLSLSVVSTVLVWRYSSWRPQFTFSRASLRDFAGFSGNMLGASFLLQLRSTSDNFLIGRFLGASSLGAYAIAYNVILVPFNRIAIPLSQVLFPAMSQIQNDLERLKTYWVRSLRVISAVAMPSLLALIVLASDFTDVVLGDSWHRAVPVIRLLAVVGLLQTFQFLNGTILQAVDRTNRYFRWTALSYVVTLGAFVVGLHWGVVGVAAAYAISAIAMEPLYAFVTARTIGLSMRELVRAIWGVAQASVATTVALAGARELLVWSGLSAGPRLVALVIGGAVMFIALCSWRAPDVIGELRRLRGQRETSDDHRQSDSAGARAAAASAAAPSA